MDLSLFFTVLLIFIFTLLAAYMRSRARDRCLKSWDGFHVTVEFADGKLVWGVMRLEPTGMELAYTGTVQDDKHIETSYLLHNNEYADIQALYRYENSLSEWGRQKRATDIQKSFHPGPFRRLRRALRNFLSTATDSLNEVFSMVLGRMTKTGGRYLAADGSSALKNLGGKVLGSVGGVYDPLLERYIGQRVVIEVLEGDEVHEHVGIFKEYSADFLEVLNVQYPQPQALMLTTQAVMQSEHLDALLDTDMLRITNNDTWPILVRSLTCADKQQFINAVVDAGETILLHVNPAKAERAQLHVQVVRELDMIVPRTRAVVRHRAEIGNDERLTDLLFDVVFDVGKLLGNRDRATEQEVRLRQELARTPDNALAAANLGCLLIQRDELVEAEYWLRQASRAEFSLPDGGRRVRMELRELERRWAERGHRPAGQTVAKPAAPAVNDGSHI